MTTQDEEFMTRAIELAEQAEKAGNLPIGAVLVCDGRIVAEGRNSIFKPEYNPSLHAEMGAMRSLTEADWKNRDKGITCYTTLEPCVMCAGTLAVVGIARIVYGAKDTEGGGCSIYQHLPKIFKQAGVPKVEGPLAAEKCDPLYERVKEIFGTSGNPPVGT